MKALNQNLSHLSQARPSAFWLKPIAPFLLEHTVRALRRRASNLIDRWDKHSNQRVLLVGGKSIEVAVTQAGTSDTQRLQVTLLRGLGRVDAYPGGDVGARNDLKRWLGPSRTLDYEGCAVSRLGGRLMPGWFIFICYWIVWRLLCI